MTIPACEPVSEIASWPMSWIAIAQSAQEIRSPVESSMSISRGDRPLGDLLRLGDQLVGRLAAGREHGDDAVAGLAGGDDPPRGALDLLGAGDGGAAELHHDDVGAFAPTHGPRIVRRLGKATRGGLQPITLVRGAETRRKPCPVTQGLRSRRTNLRPGPAAARRQPPRHPASPGAHSVEEVAGVAARLLHESFDYYLAVVQRLDPDGYLRVDRRCRPAGRGDSTDFLAQEQPVEVGVNGRVARIGRGGHGQRHPPRLRLPDPQPAHRPGSELSLPIPVAGSIWGVMNLEQEQPRRLRRGGPASRPRGRQPGRRGDLPLPAGLRTRGGLPHHRRASSPTRSSCRTPTPPHHANEVAELAVAVGERLGIDGRRARSACATRALLHDVGKIGIPGEILRKPGPLDRGRARADGRAHRDRRPHAPAHPLPRPGRAAGPLRPRALRRRRLSRRPRPASRSLAAR